MSVFIAEVVPDSGPDSGGNTVTISGCGLADVAAVSFGDVAATSFTVDSDNAVTAVAPAGTGSVPVTVTAGTGASDSVVYTYIGSPTAAPVIAAIAPQAGDPAGGSDIIAVGSGFTGATAVSFGDVPAAGFTVASDTIIAATTPPGAGSVPVTVTTDSGTSNPVTYTYSTSLPPALVSAAPKNARPGRTIVIFGCKVNRATTVRFGQTPATSFEVLSDNVILAVAPPGKGTVPITVTTPSGTSNHIPFTYT